MSQVMISVLDGGTMKSFFIERGAIVSWDETQDYGFDDQIFGVRNDIIVPRFRSNISIDLRVVAYPDNEGKFYTTEVERKPVDPRRGSGSRVLFHS